MEVERGPESEWIAFLGRRTRLALSRRLLVPRRESTDGSRLGGGIGVRGGSVRPVEDHQPAQLVLGQVTMSRVRTGHTLAYREFV